MESVIVIWVLILIAVIPIGIFLFFEEKKRKEIEEKKRELERQYQELEYKALKELKFKNWNVASYFDERVIVKSRQALEKYDDIKFFKENTEKLAKAKSILKRKNEISNVLKEFLDSNKFQEHEQYARLSVKIRELIYNACAYRISVNYITSAGNNLGRKEIVVVQSDIDKFEKDPSLLMGKGEYNKYLKEHLVVKSDDDINEIAEKIEFVRNNREKVLNEYNIMKSL